MTELAPPSLDDPKDNWLVYADALQSAGDPRGELIILNQAIEDGASTSDRDALLDRHADAIYGELAAHRGAVEVDWKWCVPVSLTLKIGPKDKPADLVKALLASPLAPAMHGLRLVAQTPSSSDRIGLGPGLALLSGGLPASCTSLELIDERADNARMLVSADYSPGSNLVDFGSLGAVWKIPHLQRLHMVVADTEQVDLGTIDAPQLQDFALLGLRWSLGYGRPGPTSEALARATWPQLRRLALRLPETYTYSWPEQYGAYVSVARYDEEPEDDYDDDDGWRDDANWSAELGGVLTGLKSTALEHLALTSFASAGPLLEALAEHGLPSTLRSLDLSQSDLSDEHVDWITEHRELFAELERLDLSDTLIGDPSPLSSLGPKIVHSSGSGAIYRFSVGME